MLDRARRHCRGDGGCHARVRHGLGRYRNIHGRRQVDTAKHDAGIGLRRAQGQLDPLTTVQAHAHRTGEGLEGSLRKHP